MHLAAATVGASRDSDQSCKTAADRDGAVEVCAGMEHIRRGVLLVDRPEVVGLDELKRAAVACQ